MGQLPSSFSNLTKLTSLLLFSCGLVGEFPKGILQLPNLQFLELFNNSDLVGYFPESHLSSHLKYLCVGNTRFSGKIPASIGNLASLEYLDFTYCNLSGLVPPSLGNLSMLTYLYLSGNNFWGQLPFSLSNLTKLTHLGIISSNLSNFLANFTQLTYLYLDSNLFTGHVPFWVMNLTKLNCLDLSENMLQGSIPSSISQLENLQNLDLFSNNLSGTVELDMLLGLKNLTQLCLSFNRFYVLGLASCNLNEFPKFLQNQEGLTYLDLAFNNIHGQIPQCSNQSLFILHWSHLLVLNISSNRFQGSLPIPPPSISFYSISINELSGEIPPQICNLNFLEVLDLSENNLSGNVPKCLGNFSNSLTILNLRRNNLNGTIPHTWTSGNKLRMINLGENKLSGQVPKSIVNCAMLEILDLGSNQINDTFPFWFGNLPELKVLILRSNGFYGVIASPEFNLAFPKLRVIDVSCNSLTGSLPSKFFQSWNAMKIVGKGHLSYMQVETRSFVRGFPDHYDYSMTVTNKGLTMKYDKIIEVYTIIDFSQNRFAGEIPESIATLKGLHTLNLSNNMFTGHIPSSIANLTQLESMDLSQNKISGEIPQQLLQLTFLESFDVSYNNLTGSIPQGNQFDTFPKSSFEGNSGLCGSQLSRKCEGFSPSISNENQGHGSSIEIDWKFVVIGYGSGFLVGFVIGQIMTTRKPNWFVNTLGIMQQKRKRQTWRGCRN
ncbi:receptor-like protein 6 [Quercus suber]|uniref:Receptor-like protein 6 n=1 Tax=Quercus suber TaxID=58331 RepID=A0AAW0JFQ2_QUESU